VGGSHLQQLLRVARCALHQNTLLLRQEGHQMHLMQPGVAASHDSPETPLQTNHSSGQ
jgi:hypothetical protein